MSEFLGFVENQTVAGQNGDRRLLADQWRTANDHIRGLEAHEAGLADGVQVQDLNSAVEPLRQQVLADPFFQKAFALVPVSIGLVELDRLVVYQKHINLTYAAALCASLGPAPNLESLVRFAFRTTPAAPRKWGPNRWQCVRVLLSLNRPPLPRRAVP